MSGHEIAVEDSRGKRGWFVGVCACGYSSRAVAYPGVAESRAIEHKQAKEDARRG